MSYVLQQCKPRDDENKYVGSRKQGSIGHAGDQLHVADGSLAGVSVLDIKKLDQIPE